MKYSFYLLKRTLEDILMYPLVLLGKAFGTRILPNEHFDHLLIFPFHHLGGAERVHLNIARALSDKKCLILFTRKSKSIGFREAFQKTGHRILDISAYTDNKWLYFLNIFFRGAVSGWVNTHKVPIFNGQSNFGYKISPWIDASIPQIELIHAFCSFSWIRIPFVAYFTKTVMISKHAIDLHEKQYKSLNIPDELKNRILYIPNGIDIQKDQIIKPKQPPLNVLFIGRPDKDKRPTLYAQIAEKCSMAGISARFQVIGEFAEFIPSNYHRHLEFHGAVSDDRILQNIYSQTHLLVVCSLHEGFPMVIAEAMANGSAILSTPVGDIPHHIKHGVNGFLFSTIEKEEKIISEAVENIQSLVNNPELLYRMSSANAEYAKEIFGLAKFESRYQALFKEIPAE